MTQREEFVNRLKAAKTEYKTAGPIHQKDLRRQICQMKKDLRLYDLFHQQSKKIGGDTH